MKNIFFFFLIVNLFSGINPIDAHTLISKGSVWKYLDDGSDQGTAWKEVDFNDAAWESGPAILGYGSISAGSISTSLSYGGNSSSKYATTYFRTSFDYSPVGDETSLIFNFVFCNVLQS